LHKIIAYYSQVRVKKDAIKRTIFPTGSAALVFRCDLNNPGAFFVGTPSTPREAEYVTLGCDYFLVWFWPGMGYSFFPIPAIETIDQACPLDKINTAEAGKITESVLLAQSFQERVAIFERFMERHMALLPEIPNNLSSLIATACDRIHVLTNEEMESCLGYGERHIRRLFLKYVGVSPVLFKRIRRHQNTLKAMKVLLDQDLAGLAAEQGYFDQSHLIREFKQFLGTTPTQFVRECIREGQQAVPFGGKSAEPVGAEA
jgi:AraC-like DNA-binding protein